MALNFTRGKAPIEIVNFGLVPPGPPPPPPPNGIGLPYGLLVPFPGSPIVGDYHFLTWPRDLKSQLLQWHMLCTPAATVAIDIWKKTTFPPLVGDSIIATGIKPFTTAQDENEGFNFQNWTTTIIMPGDRLWFQVTANDLAIYIALTLSLVRVL